jgi:N-acetylneuraminic acid mutarotase
MTQKHQVQRSTPQFLLAALLLLSAWPARAEQYHGNGDPGFGGAIGNGTLTLTDDGTNISGTLTPGGSMNDVLVLYIQSGPGGFADTSGFNDQGDACRQAISGASAAGRSLLTFASGFQPNYAIALAPAATSTGGLYQLADGTNNSLVYVGSINLAPLNNSGPYTFSFPGALIGMIPGVRSTIQLLGTDLSTNGYRSTEAIAGNLIGVQGWNPFTQTAYASYTFDTGAVLVRLPLGVWTQHPGAPPAARDYHTAVWTGTEMIVWGGVTAKGSYLNDGGRYNPAANAWTALPVAGAPAGRWGHTAVWTGSEMIVWGGYAGLNDGGRYNPAANAWAAVPTNGAPAGRMDHSAVWTGSEMIVWGGWDNGHCLNDGGRYNPAVNSWAALPINGAPAPRYNHTAAWTGSEMIVWAGYGYRDLNDGGRFNPNANTWTAVPTNGAPSARHSHAAVWTGSEMLVWGGWIDELGGSYLNDGGRYNPTANAWTALTTTGTPAGRWGFTAVWTGAEMIVWGGYNGSFLNNGGRYNPTADTWTALPTTGAPTARDWHTAVWTGSEMLAWGGQNATTNFNDGGRYNPTLNSWAGLAAGVATAREGHTAVWTGNEMILWGGTYDDTSRHYLGDGGRYNPTLRGWFAVTTTGAPAPRVQHTAVWTGSEMIVWGGYNENGYFNDGGRYDPVANSWKALPSAGAPSARYRHTAVWTGNEMIVWGGVAGSYLNDGGRYNPMTDGWTAIPTNGAPEGRYWHTAVWTGNEMIVWGGCGFGSQCDPFLSDGGRYSPGANTWLAVPTNGAPSGRYLHTAVWSGSEMIVWGGWGNDIFKDGGRYNPTANTWTTLASTGAPNGRYSHTAVWTGSEMIVWGGYSNGFYYADGGRYIPAANAWTSIPRTIDPAARQLHTAVWTGSEMIISGGYGSRGPSPDTWSYCPYAPVVRVSWFSPTSADIAWPVWSPALCLYQTTDLAAGQWTAVTNEPTQVGSENHVTVSPLKGRQFFRVEYP